MQSVLLVCLGNICRSPLAEAALRHAANSQGLDLEVDSAGTGDWHVGHPPDVRAQEVALRLGGLDISGLRARQVSPDDFHRFDHIIAMDQDNLSNLQAMVPATSAAKLSLLLDYVAGSEGKSVDDPYFGEIADFEACWHQIKAAAQSFAKSFD